MSKQVTSLAGDDLQTSMARYLRVALMTNGHTTAWIVEKTGIPVSRVKSLLRNRAKMTVGEFETLANLLGVDTSGLRELLQKMPTGKETPRPKVWRVEPIKKWGQEIAEHCLKEKKEGEQ